MSGMDDLIAFIGARLDEDEAAARAAMKGALWVLGVGALNPQIPAAIHIARHDPARALREVAAGRELIAVCLDSRLAGGMKEETPSHAEWNNAMAARTDALELALTIYAKQWSGHPDYRDEWSASAPD